MNNLNPLYEAKMVNRDFINLVCKSPAAKAKQQALKAKRMSGIIKKAQDSAKKSMELEKKTGTTEVAKKSSIRKQHHTSTKPVEFFKQ